MKFGWSKLGPTEQPAVPILGGRLPVLVSTVSSPTVTLYDNGTGSIVMPAAVGLWTDGEQVRVSGTGTSLDSTEGSPVWVTDLTANGGTTITFAQTLFTGGGGSVAETGTGGLLHFKFPRVSSILGTQATLIKMPRLNTLGRVQYDGTDDVSEHAEATLSGSWALYWVMSKRAATDDVFPFGTASGGNQMRFFNATSISITTSAGTLSFTQSAMADNTLYFYKIVATPTRLDIYRNLVSIGASVADPGTFKIAQYGRYGASSYRKPDFVACEGFNSPTASQLATLDTYYDSLRS